MHVTRYLAAAALLCAAFVAATRAQSTDNELERRFYQQQRLVDQRVDDARREQTPIDSRIDWQWGGWLEYYVFSFDDGIQESRIAQRPGLSLWSRLQIDDGAHEFFARVKLRYTSFDSGDEIERQEDWWGPNFDQAWYQLDLRKALHGDTGRFNVRTRIGRQPVVFGTGYALDLPLDALWLDLQFADLRAIGLIGRTVPSYPNIDRSEPVDSHMNRTFYGVQLQYEGWDRHVPFVYALWNRDYTDERPWAPLQNYTYDSFYAGFGSRGDITHNLSYWAEGVFESGHSYGDHGFLHRDYVEAFAWDAGLEQRFDVPMRPRLVGEYMFASGDADRLYSPTSSLGGNRVGTVDTGFAGFGFRDTGIALSPILSNLHIWRVGATVAPLEHIELFHDLEIGTNWFVYHKHHHTGAISDTTAEEFEGYVGWEMDYFINWRVASDLSWTLRWGTFFPGSAYGDTDSRHFLFTGVTWSF